MSSFSTMMNIAPSSCPPVQHIVLGISGDMGYVISTRYSRITGKIAKLDAPSSAAVTNGPATLDAPGANTNPMYVAAAMGTRILTMPRWCLNRSVSGEQIAAATRPTTMSRAPVRPASVSEKPCGSRI